MLCNIAPLPKPYLGEFGGNPRRIAVDRAPLVLRVSPARRMRICVLNCGWRGGNPDFMAQALLAALVLLTLGATAQPAAAAPVTCLEPPYQEAETAGERELVSLVSELRAALSEFPVLLALVDSRQPRFCLSDELRTARAFYEPETNRIVLASGLETGLALAVLAHEMRHVYQFEYGVCPSHDLAMRDYARAVFAMEADANVVSLLVAWHLRSGGDPRMWTALAVWPMTADIAARFEGAMTATQDIPAAAAAAFDQWYASGTRREKYYIAACSDYLDQIDRTHALPDYGALPGDFLDRLCLMPDGSTYPCAEAGNALER